LLKKIDDFNGSCTESDEGKNLIPEAGFYNLKAQQNLNVLWPV
jgi:hypothetical protein